MNIYIYIYIYIFTHQKGSMDFFFPRDSFNLIIQRNKILLVDLTKTYKKQIVCSLNSALINDRDLLV